MICINKTKSEYWLPIVLSLAVGVLYASFVFGLPWRFNSPDETANAFFSQRVASGQTMAADASLNNLVEGNIIHPRSIAVVAGKLVPRSFLGLPIIFGSLGKLFGSGILPYLPAIFAVVGLLALAWFANQSLNKSAGIIIIILASVLPAFWYYQARGFFHNALFLDLFFVLLLCSWWLLKYGKWWWYLILGLVLGLVLAVRTAEGPWILVCGLIWLLLNKKLIKFRYLFLTLIGAGLSFWSVLLTNKQLFGVYFSVGYRPELGIDSVTSEPSQIISLFKEIILPFGFNLNNIWQNTQHYLIGLQWWWAVLFLIGVVYFVVNWSNKSATTRSYFIVGLLASLWLVAVYGSWSFHDNPDPGAITIGTAYLRYWLPIFIFGLWLAAEPLSRMWSKHSLMPILVTIIGIHILLSWWMTYHSSDDSLAQVKANIIRFEETNKIITELTPDNAVIISGITDKFFFPQRQVIVELVTDNDYQSVVKLLQNKISVYQFRTPIAATELKNKIAPTLESYGMMLTPVKVNIGEHVLYKYNLIKS